jgi:copper transport protein
MSTPPGTMLRLAISAAAVALALPGSARAHAVLLQSSPADGARLASSPQHIRLTFNEDVSRKLSEVRLIGAHAGRVSGVRVSGSSRALNVSLPELREDTYILRWRTVSEADLHATGGSLVFGVGAAPGNLVPDAGPDGPSGAEIFLRWLDFSAIAGLIGALALLAICVPQAERRGASGLERARRKLVALASICSMVALVTGVGLLVFAAHRLSTESTGSALKAVLTQTSYGSSWIVREILIASLFVVGPLVGRRQPGPFPLAFTLGAVLALCASMAASSHSASARGQVSVATGALALHLLSAALWAGGVGALLVVLVGAAKDLRADASTPFVLRSFGGLAALSVSVLALTGIYSAGVDVASPDALVTTLYGRTLIAKTALFLFVGLIGLGNSLLVHSGRHSSRWLGRGVRLELALASGVVLLAALLTATPPAQALRAQAVRKAEPAGQAIESVTAGDLLVSLSVKPNQPGINFITAGVFDTRRPAPGAVRGVEFAVGSADARKWLAARKVRNRYWQIAGGQLSRSRRWPISVRIHRSGLPDQLARVSWNLPALRPLTLRDRTVLSSRPLSPLLSRVAVVGALALAAALLLIALRQNRGFGSGSPSARNGRTISASNLRPSD